MQYNITTSLFVSLSENGFSLDELIYRMEDLANKKAFPLLLKTILLLVDENLRLNLAPPHRLFDLGGGDGWLFQSCLFAEASCGVCVNDDASFDERVGYGVVHLVGNSTSTRLQP